MKISPRLLEAHKRSKTLQGRAYLIHASLAGIVSIVLVAQIYFWATGAGVSEVGGSTYIFFICLGLPSLGLFVAAIYLSLRLITDWRIVLLAAVLLAVVISLESTWSLVVSNTTGSIYVLLTAFLASRWFLGSRKEPGDIEEGTTPHDKHNSDTHSIW